MRRVTGWSARQRQLGPTRTDEVEAQLCEAEVAGIDSFRIPLGVRSRRARTAPPAMAHLVEREQALHWLASRGMVHNLVRLLRDWRMESVSVRATRRAAALMAALPRCPRLWHVEVQAAGLGREAFFHLRAAGQLTSLHLDECWIDKGDATGACTWLAGCRNLPLTRLVATRATDAWQVDLVTQMIAVSRLRILKLNLGHAGPALEALVRALAGQSNLRVLMIRLKRAEDVVIFLQGLLGSACLASLASLKIYCRRLAMQPVEAGRVVALAQAVVDAAPYLPRVHFE